MALKFLNNGYFAGKVGIGTESPSAKLHVNPTTTDEIAIAINGTQNYSAGEFQRIAAGDANSLDRLAIGFGYDNPTDWAIRYSSYGRHEFYTGNDWGNAANTEKMVITSSGNVGIGTTSPSAKFQVYSTATRDISIFGHGTQAQNNWQAEHAFFISAGQGVIIGKANASNNTNRLHLFYNTSNGDAQYMLHNTSSTNIVKLNTNGDSFFNGGNVGIGTTSPATTLQVNGLISANQGAGNGYTFVGDLDTSIERPAQNTITLITAGNERMRITSAGNVGIGTTSPGQKLDVNGNIKIQAALLSNQENTDVDTGTETVANVAIATYTAAFFDFVIKKTTNVRSGTVYACHDGTNVEFTETSTKT